MKSSDVRALPENTSKDFFGYIKSLTADMKEMVTVEENFKDLEEESKLEVCDKCKAKKNLEFFEFPCGCHFCETCMNAHLNYLYDVKVCETDIQCFNESCQEKSLKARSLKEPSSTNLIARFLGKAKLQEIKEIKKSRAAYRFACPICADVYDMDKIVTFDCDCRLCEGCCTFYLQERVKNQMDGFEIPCFNEKCKAPQWRKGMKNGIYLVKRLLGEEVCSKIEFALANKQAKYSCALCQFPFDIPDNDPSEFVLCNECGGETCLKCKKKRHKGKDCAKVDDEIKEFLRKEGQITRICPSCLKPMTKDEGCDHVKCIYCKVDFCFMCSVIRSPTLEHGNHYHRKGCKNYSPWVDKNGNDIFGDEKKNQCTECQKAGKLCARPSQTLKEFYIANKALEYFEIVEENES